MKTEKVKKTFERRVSTTTIDQLRDGFVVPLDELEKFCAETRAHAARDYGDRTYTLHVEICAHTDWDDRVDEIEFTGTACIQKTQEEIEAQEMNRGTALKVARKLRAKELRESIRSLEEELQSLEVNDADNR